MPDVPAQHRHRQLAAACSLVAAAMIAAGLAGCEASPSIPPATTPQVSTSAATASRSWPTPSSTPSATSQSNYDEAAIKQAVMDFRVVTERLSMHPNADLEQLRSVATGPLLEVELRTYRQWRAKGWRATKAVKIEHLKVDSVKAATATASYCADSTDVDVVDRNGKSQVVIGRPDMFPKLVQLTRTKEGDWIPAQQTTEGDACDID